MNGLVVCFLLVSSFMMNTMVSARRDCGTSITDRCRSSYDIRYDPKITTDLIPSAKAWERIHGLYMGEIYSYNTETYFREVDPNFAAPFFVYLNITVVGTRAYRHISMYRRGQDALSDSEIRIGDQIHCDSVSIATWEKDGIANNLRTICSNDDDDDDDTLLPNNFDEDESRAFPISDVGIQFDEVLRDDNAQRTATENSLVTLSSSYKCVTMDCSRMSVIMEKFDQRGRRQEYKLGDLIRIANETTYIAGVNNAPEFYLTGEVDSISLPMIDTCLNAGRCYSDISICLAGDTIDSCRDILGRSFVDTPYQDEDSNIQSGVIAAFVIASIIFAIIFVSFVYYVLKKQQVDRYRYFFATRMADTLTTDKFLDEFTPDDMTKEYEQLVEKSRNQLNKDNMYEFLSTGELGYMDWGDYEALWTQLDRDKNGDASFLEFCSFLGHSWTELEAVKASRVEQQQQETNDANFTDEN